MFVAYLFSKEYALEIPIILHLHSQELQSFGLKENDKWLPTVYSLF